MKIKVIRIKGIYNKERIELEGTLEQIFAEIFSRIEQRAYGPEENSRWRVEIE